jgi:hypothetical protein
VAAATATEPTAWSQSQSQHRQPGARIALSAAVGLMLTASGCASQHSAARAAPTTPHDCAVPSGASAGSQTAAARYLAIANAGNHHLDADFDRLGGPDQGTLAAAQADLRDAVATERLFDRCLLTIAFPPQTEAVAQQLYSANEARADLTATAAGSASLSQLAGYDKQLTAANVPVERAVTTIRAQLGLPPASTS